MKRIAALSRIAALIGPALRIVDERKGWPALAEFSMPEGNVPLSLFVSRVIRSHRGRDHAERRLENPGTGHPIIVPSSTIPVLLGFWELDDLLAVPHPLLTSTDAWRREGRMTRFSVFIPLDGLRDAIVSGFDRRFNTDDELVTCLWPEQFNVLIRSLLVDARARPRTRVPDAPLSTEIDIEYVERERRMIAATVRATDFGFKVVSAYNERCALCDLDLGLVQGAHIYPVSAPGSQDEVWNGLSLCANHHVAFDRHLIFIDPETRQAKQHPWLRDMATRDPVAQAFSRSTLSRLAEPRDPSLRPLDEMFSKRYEYYGEPYGWSRGRTDVEAEEPADD